MPFSEIQTTKGVIIDGGIQIASYSRNSAYDPYFRLVLIKSDSVFTYTRTVQKISSVFSYIGGFFGALTAALFFVKIYTDSSF